MKTILVLLREEQCFLFHWAVTWVMICRIPRLLYPKGLLTLMPGEGETFNTVKA